MNTDNFEERKLNDTNESEEVKADSIEDYEPPKPAAIQSRRKMVEEACKTKENGTAFWVFIFLLVSVLCISLIIFISLSRNSANGGDGDDDDYEIADKEDEDDNNETPHSHEYGSWKTIYNATCTADGERERRCSCGLYEREVIPATGHSEVAIDAIEATCQNIGYTEGKMCENCGKITESPTAVPKADHDLTNIVAESDYCGDRQVSSVYCGTCGEFITSYGHHYIKTVVEADCTNDGEIRHTCDRCGHTYAYTIPAGGHVKSEYEIASKPTCTDSGTAVQKCLVCHETLDSVTVDPTDHSYTTTYSDKILTHSCTKCGHTYTEKTNSTVYTVTFMSDGAVIGSTSVKEGAAVTEFPKLSKDGYILTYWSLDDENASLYNACCIYEDTTLVAVWEEAEIFDFEESDIAVHSGVGTDFAFTVISDSLDSVTKGLKIYNINNETVDYNVVFVGDGKYEITSHNYLPSKSYYATADDKVTFVGTESKEIQFSIAGENNIEITVNSSVKYLEYSDVYGIIEGEIGQLLLTNIDLNAGDKVIIYEDSIENMVLAIIVTGVYEELGYNAYTFELPEYDQIFDNLEVDFTGDLSSGTFEANPMLEEEFKQAFKESTAYANVRKAAVVLSDKFDFNFGEEKIEFSLGTEGSHTIGKLKYTIQMDEGWEICVIYSMDLSSYLDYHLSLTDHQVIYTTVLCQSIQIELTKSEGNGVKYFDENDEYHVQMREMLQNTLQELQESGHDSSNLNLGKGGKTVLIGGVDLPIAYGISARFSISVELSFEFTGTVGFIMTTETYQSVGERNFETVESHGTKIKEAGIYMNAKMRFEALAKVELFIHVAGIGVYGNIGVGPYVEVGGAGSMSYIEGTAYFPKFTVYLDAGTRFEANIGFKATIGPLVLVQFNYEAAGIDIPFKDMPLGSKEIWVGFKNFDDEERVSYHCDCVTTIDIDDIIDTHIYYKNVDDMITKIKKPDNKYVKYSIISASGYRSKIRIKGNTLTFDSIGDVVDIEIGIWINDFINKIVVIRYTPEHTENCIHNSCAAGNHVGGTATCMDKAICERCGLEYGEEPIGYHSYEDRQCVRCGDYLPSEGLFYALLDDGTYEVTGMGSCKDRVLVIPETYNDIPVTSIKGGAFERNKTIGRVVMPDSITKIGSLAFKDCSYLYGIVISDNILTIGHDAFDDTGYKNNSTNWRNHALYIGKYLIDYYDYYGYGTYTIEDGTKVIADRAFQYSNLEGVVIPDSVISIGERAFDHCERLSSITIPDSVTSIGSSAFEGCYYLSSVTIGASVKEIGYATFRECERLTDIVIPDNVTTIGYSAFGGCKSLSSAVIGNSVTTINGFAFYNCEQLKSVILGESVREIHQYAFSGCAFTEIKIPSSVIKIYKEAFGNYASLKSVIFENTVGWWCERMWNMGLAEYKDTYYLSDTDLADTDIAAQYLKYSYVSYNWYRTE